jgi:hypothetical protein
VIKYAVLYDPELFAELETMFSTFLDARGQELKSEFYIPFAADELIQAGKARCKMLTSEDRWFGVTYQEDKQTVIDAIHALVDSGVYTKDLFDDLEV